MKIAIVNDTVMAAEALRRIIGASTEHQVIWTAGNGTEAVAACMRMKPDLILMDLIMPDMDGVEATRLIMQNAPCAILIVTATPDDNVGQIFRAMGAGALDVTATPVLAGTNTNGASLLAKIKTIGKLIQADIAANMRAGRSAEATVGDEFGATIHTLVAIGASTGGPVALTKVLSDLRPAAGTAIVVVQHIDERFADNFAKWLGTHVTLPVDVIDDNAPLRPNRIMLAKSNDHLLLDRRNRFRYSAEPQDYAYRPSVNVFFHSVVEHWLNRAIGVLLTGMGRDGAEGLLAMRRAGHLTIAQDQASSAVYGMPRAAAELSAAEMILHVDKIATILRERTLHLPAIAHRGIDPPEQNEK